MNPKKKTKKIYREKTERELKNRWLPVETLSLI